MRALSALWLLPVAGLAALVAARDTSADPGDLLYFLDASGALLSGSWADIYANPDLQAGPVFLAALARLPLEALAYAIEIAVGLLVVLVVRRLLGDRTRAQAAALAAGAAAVGIGLTHAAFVDGHPAQAAIPLIWVLAGLEARKGRAVVAGALIGISAGFELWGVLGAPLLVLAPRLRHALGGLAVQTAVTLALYAPFVLLGEFRMFEYRWEVAEGTLLGLVVNPGTPFPWPLRLAQGAIAVAIGTLLARRLRRAPYAVWLVPLAVVGVRIVLDPVRYSWYWLAFETLALVGAAEFLTRAPSLLRARHASPQRQADGSAAGPSRS